MKKTHSAVVSEVIGVPVGAVWKALVDPALVKRYLFGTDMKADWKVGGNIVYSGEWQGKRYEDKGVILELKEGALLKTTYWSSMSGQPDLPENRSVVAYSLKAEAGGTRITIKQENIESAESAEHSAANWKGVLEGMKALLETKR
jgi:uncharacterized protein YndB with AHSA1/START domain